MNKKKEIKAGIILLGLIMLSTILTYLFSLTTEKIGIFLLGYLFLFVITNIVSSKIENKSIKILFEVIASPMAIFYFIGKFYLPVSTIILHSIIYVLVVTFLPLIFIKTNNYFEILNISSENYIFITLTFASIFSILFHKQIIEFVYIVSPMGANKSNNTEKLKLKELTEYVITPQNIRFSLYSLYFVYLCIFSIKYLDQKSFFETELVDGAIMQAFIVFLAFDSLIANSKEVKLLPSILLKKILESFFYEDQLANTNKKQDKK